MARVRSAAFTTSTPNRHGSGQSSVRTGDLCRLASWSRELNSDVAVMGPKLNRMTRENVENPGTIESELWLQRLRFGAVDREAAIDEMRGYLVRAMRRSLTHRYGGHVDVEDVVQQAILKILDSLDTFRHQSRFTTWATSIAVRIGISQLRRSYYRDVSLDAASESGEIRIDVADSPSHLSADSEERGRILELLQRLINETLSDKQRLAIQGTLKGLPVEEIAVRLNSNRNAIYKLVHDARVKLREGFESSGVTAEQVLATIS